MTEYKVAMTEKLSGRLTEFLLKDKRDEEICFATWHPAAGSCTYNMLLRGEMLPGAGDRTRHGNVSAHPQYVRRCKEQARKEGAGLAMIHTHPAGRGHQDVSDPDVYYEQGVLAPEVFGLTGLPLLGMTLAGDGTWSARAYPRPFKIRWCSAVKTVGRALRANFHPGLAPRPRPGRGAVRTASVWGEGRQADIARLCIGVIGAGSIGAAVCEALARMGVGRVILMDYDIVKVHNLDRMLGALASDAGRAKSDIVAENMRKAATLDGFSCKTSPHSVVEEEGFAEALGCDLLFSCVDRPWPRQVLNHMAYSCLIPVVNGAVYIDSPGGALRDAQYRAETVGPGRPCLDCLGSLDVSRIQQDREGLFDDPGYMGEQARRDGMDARQNVMPFVLGLASLELMQFAEVCTFLGKRGDMGQQSYNYRTGEIRVRYKECRRGCKYAASAACGDSCRPRLGVDKSRALRAAAEAGGGKSAPGVWAVAEQILRAVAAALGRRGQGRQGCPACKRREGAGASRRRPHEKRLNVGDSL